MDFLPSGKGYSTPFDTLSFGLTVLQDFFNHGPTPQAEADRSPALLNPYFTPPTRTRR